MITKKVCTIVTASVFLLTFTRLLIYLLIMGVLFTKPFYLGKYEVTQKQWEAVMGNNPSSFLMIGPQYSVENVSWEDCQAFLKKIKEKFANTGAKFSLPTEAQWEYARRAGSTNKYGFGDTEASLSDYAWFGGNAGGFPHPVGEKKPNA